MDASPQDELHGLIAAVGLELFSPDVRAEVERLLSDGQALEPVTRQQFVDAANRGVRKAGFGHLPLETVLFNTRRDLGQSLAQVAGVVGVDEGVLDAVERGSATIDSGPPELVASWVRTLGIGRHIAVSTLKRSLATRDPRAVFANQAEPHLSADQAAFVLRVEVLLQEASGDVPTSEP
jgi:hypothetical protein